ncbi:MAG: aspartate-semialdehyde dehydrogenase [Clostridia bacterium]|jgi:aspartate-semialdehyde dehydrogenase
MKNYKLAIVGATGVVGRTVLQVLQERNLPISKYVFFASKKSAGKTIHFMGKDSLVQELTESSFDEGFDYAIFSAGGSTSLKYAPIAVSKGCIVIDNSSAFRMEPNVPLVVPEVNPDVIKNHHGIIANPNCSTIQAMPVLKPLEDNYKIKRIIYSTYQAVSGAGQKGINDLENGIINYVHYNSLETPLEKFPHPIFNNCLPHIDVFLDNGYTKEEEKMINETRKILGRSDIKITATTVRVPVFNSHSESINVELENSFELSDIISLLKRSPNVVVQDDLIHNIYPLAANVSGNDEVFVGRIRRDFSIENGLNLWVVADNIRKGAATNAIQIVENLIELDH